MMRTNRHEQHDSLTGQRDSLAEQPTPETPEPLEEEARREQALADSRSDEHEGPGPVYSPSGAHTADHDGVYATDRDGAYADEQDGTHGTYDGTDGTAHSPADGTAYGAGDRTDGTEDGRFREPYARPGDDVLDPDRSRAYDGDRLVAGSPRDGAHTTTDGTATYDTVSDDTTDGAQDTGTADGTAYVNTVTRDGEAATVDGPVAYPATVTTAASGSASGLDEQTDGRWREIKAGFVDDPRRSVEQADALVEEALNALTARRQTLLGTWKDNERGDTEALRLALHEYHSLLVELTRK